MSIGTPSEINATKARIRELRELWSETHNATTVVELFAASQDGDASADLEVARRAQLGAAIKEELAKLEAKRKELRKNTPREFFSFSALLLLGIAMPTWLLIQLARTQEVDWIIGAAGTTYAATCVAAGCSNTRWQGRKGLGLEASE